MASIPGSELIPQINACQARWVTHLKNDVHSGRSDHARAYLRNCESGYQLHRHPDGVGGFMQPGGMGSWMAIEPESAALPQAVQAAEAQFAKASAEARVAAGAAAKIRQVAPGTTRHHARSAFKKSRSKLVRCRRKLRRCQARLAALREGATPQQAERAAACACPPAHAADVEGLGFTPTRGAGYAPQYQRVESRPAWGSQLPQQSIAEGYGYRFPSTESAFLEREARVQGGHGGVFSGQIKAGLPARVHPLIAQLYPQLQVQHQQPWTNPWTYSQFFANTPRGVPIWGGGYTQPFQPVQGAGTTRPPVANAQNRFSQPGTTVERF